MLRQLNRIDFGRTGRSLYNAIGRICSDLIENNAAHFLQMDNRGFVAFQGHNIAHFKHRSAGQQQLRLAGEGRVAAYIDCASAHNGKESSPSG